MPIKLTLHFSLAAHAIVAFCLLLTWDVVGYSATCHAGIFCTAVRLLAQQRKILHLLGNGAALAIGILHDQVYVEHSKKAAAWLRYDDCKISVFSGKDI
mgnify:CR=1 FL=1